MGGDNALVAAKTASGYIIPSNNPLFKTGSLSLLNKLVPQKRTEDERAAKVKTTQNRLEMALEKILRKEQKRMAKEPCSWSIAEQREEVYADSCRAFARKPPSKREIVQFVLSYPSTAERLALLVEYGVRMMDTVFGAFLAAAMNCSEEDGFVLSLSHFPAAPDYVGYRNGKKLTVIGDAGADFCNSMEGGRVFLEGNAESAAGSMQGGKLAINGEVGLLAWNMSGGEIRVNGGIGSLGWPGDGSIYLNGEQIVRRGNRIGRGAGI